MSKFAPSRLAAKAVPAVTAVARNAPHEVRLIGGQWKRSKLRVLDKPGLRPTPDRVRETLFNWLGQDLAGWRVLDAFAGSGALGFEAASRGAAEVLLLESDRQLVAELNANRLRLKAGPGLKVLQADALAWMKHAPAGDFDLVMLDPPFGADLFETALVAAARCLVAEGLAYLEADRAFDPAALQVPGFELLRQGQAGQVHYHLLRRTSA
ncbi:MAG: rRNA ((966)-N(2))-methyltransferase RsmD [Pseudomonadota bacterium]|jgi:16S rRNA (guanine(966)-N(2))-methyltransferase RsmD